MKTFMKTDFSGQRANKQRGFNLMEVLIGIAIFAIGMMALASLQGNLTRSASDANARAVATNIAEEIIELRRGFGRIDTDPLGVIPAYADIVSGNDTLTRGGIDYTIVSTVTPYYFDLATGGFLTIVPTGLPVSDFKNVQMTVSWSSPDFRTVEGQTADISSGSISVSDTISSITSAASSRVATSEENELPLPTVDYSPGENPDIVSLSLGDNKFKESLTPEPDVIRASELVETKFDVITYSQADGGALFLRREEFRAVSCECELKAAPNDASLAGRRPTVWLADEYLEPEFINKPYGISANNSQSNLCDTCCQDHHDGGSGTYDPAGDTGAIHFDAFRDGDDYWGENTTFEGDHKHYKKDRRGVLSLAENVDDVYVEACKLVRKDGFFRIAQDFRQEGLNTFPYDYLDQTAEVNDYSAFATGAVSTYVAATSDGYEATPPTLTSPSRTLLGIEPAPGAGDLTLDYTNLPTVLGADFQQLRSRGIYLDYMNDGLRTVITCLKGGGDAVSCQPANPTPYDVVLDQTGSSNVLETLPFFDVQMTFLNRWTEDPLDDPVETTDEPLETGNLHSRGQADKVQTSGDARVYASGHRGNLGLTDTDPIDFGFSGHVAQGDIQVVINTDNPPDPSGTIISGTFVSGVPGIQASGIIVTASNALCDRTPDGFTCLVPTGASGPTMTVSNYHKKTNKNVVACSYDLTLPGTNGSDTSNNPFTIFSLSTALSTTDYVISIEANTCIAPA